MPRDRVYRDFDRIDREVHELMESLNAAGVRGGAVQRSARRVRTATQQLHYLLSQGDPAPQRIGDVRARQVQSLYDAAEDLNAATQSILHRENPAGLQAINHVAQFTEAVQGLQRALQAGRVRHEDLRGAFGGLDQAWSVAVNDLNNPASGADRYLLDKAQRVGMIFDNLHQQFGFEGRPSRLRQFP